MQANEMRVIACGTGMPQPRLKQAGSCFLVELGNGAKFVFDMGKGSTERLAALGIPTDQLNKVFITHLHFDHADDFPSFWLARGVNAARQPLYLWGRVVARILNGVFVGGQKELKMPGPGTWRPENPPVTRAVPS